MSVIKDQLVEALNELSLSANKIEGDLTKYENNDNSEILNEFILFLQKVRILNEHLKDFVINQDDINIEINKKLKNKIGSEINGLHIDTVLRKINILKEIIIKVKKAEIEDREGEKIDSIDDILLFDTELTYIESVESAVKELNETNVEHLENLNKLYRKYKNL